MKELKIKRAALALIVSVVFAGLTVVGAFWLRSDTIDSRQVDICQAIKINNEILTDFLLLAERRSIQAIEEGQIKDQTPEEIVAFYRPVITKLDRGEC